MAVTFDHAAAAVTQANQREFAWVHEVGPGDGRVLFVAIGAGTAGTPDGTIAPTVDGQPMQYLTSQIDLSYSFVMGEWWYMLDPPEGEALIHYDRGMVIGYPVLGSLSVTGVDLASPWLDPEINMAAPAPSSVTAPSVEGGMQLEWVLQISHTNATRDLHPMSGQAVLLDLMLDRSGSAVQMPHITATATPGTGAPITLEWDAAQRVTGCVQMVFPLRPMADEPDPEPDPIEAEGSATIPALQATGEGASRITAAGGAPLIAPEASGAATSRIMATGQGAIPTSQAAGAGSSSVQGAGTSTLPALDAAGAGDVRIAASGRATLQAPAAGGEATSLTTGAGTGGLPPVEGAGSGNSQVTGEGAATLPPLKAGGSSEEINRATGGATLGGLQATGSATTRTTGGGGAAVPAPGAQGVATVYVRAAGGARIEISAAGWAVVRIPGAGLAMLPALVAGGGAPRRDLPPPRPEHIARAAAVRRVAVSDAPPRTAQSQRPRRVVG